MSENPESLRIAGAAYFDEFTKTHDLLSALEAQARRITELEGELKFELHDRKEWMKLFVARGERIAELEAAGNLVVEWWLTEGMKVMNGAPYAMFKLRAALRNTK